MIAGEPFLMDRLLGPGGIRPVMQPMYDLSRGTPSPSSLSTWVFLSFEA